MSLTKSFFRAPSLRLTTWFGIFRADICTVGVHDALDGSRRVRSRDDGLDASAISSIPPSPGLNDSEWRRLLPRPREVCENGVIGYDNGCRWSSKTSFDCGRARVERSEAAFSLLLYHRNKHRRCTCVPVPVRSCDVRHTTIPRRKELLSSPPWKKMLY